jgi:hypothetical protein
LLGGERVIRFPHPIPSRKNQKQKADPPPSHPSEQKPLAGDPGSAKNDNQKDKDKDNFKD